MVAAWGTAVASSFPTGTRIPLAGDSVTGVVVREGRPHRIDDYTTASGEIADGAQHYGVHSAVGCPVVVGDQIWGAIVVATSGDEPCPPDTEQRLAQFADLAATAIANAQARAEVERLADEQAALRRVATLVASGVDPGPLFDAVAGEAEALFGADISAVVRFEGDGTVTVMGAHGGPHNQGARVQLDPDYIVAAVHRTGQAARFDSEDWEGEPPGVVRDMGMRSALATPIVVEGELWGRSRSRRSPARSWL